MKKILKISLYGLMAWAAGFIIGMIAFPLYDSQFMLFKSIMVVAGTLITIILLARHFGKITSGYIREGVLAGTIWLIVNIALDLIVLVGLLNNPVVDYLINPGISYLYMPVLSIGVGYILNKKQ